MAACNAPGAVMLSLACVCLPLAAAMNTHQYMGESDEEMMEKARAEAVRMGQNPDDVVRMGAPFVGEWDEHLENKRCSGCIGSMIELSVALTAAGKKKWNLRDDDDDAGRGNQRPRLKELVQLDSIEVACGELVKDYGFGEVDGRSGYFHKRQEIIRTIAPKIGVDMSEMCFRLAEDGDRQDLLSDAHLISRHTLAWKSCVLLNQDEPRGGMFAGAMCSESAAREWLSILIPAEEPRTGAGKDDVIALTFEQFVENYGYRLRQSEERGGPGGKEVWNMADQDRNGFLSREEIAVPKIKAIVAPKSVDLQLFKQKFGTMTFKKGRTTEDVFKLLDANSDGDVTLEEMSRLKGYLGRDL